MGEAVSIFNRVTFSKASLKRRLGSKGLRKGKERPPGCVGKEPSRKREQ